ncbi:MAG TPA: flagellar biosynthesis protein FlhF [Virgibacillus sp.]|nr:flagellar biosynthesis protein FlhF [Virgibacillus sp.]
MKVKKYVAPTMPEVMSKIRKELGPDAVILNSKEIKRGGFFGFFEKRNIEVVAALDPEPINPKSTGETQTSSTNLLKAEENNIHTDVLQEIKHLKSMIEHQAFRTTSNYLPDYQFAYQHLIDQEVDVQLAQEIMDTVLKQHEENGEMNASQTAMRDIQSEIENRLNDISFQGITYEEQIIHFVGPTGVGKTTTIAKIAANCMLNDHKKVAFITTDTYRIAAIDQLKTYARILNIPIEVAYTTKDYQMALKKFASYDVILVDTAGRNFRDDKYIHELKNMIDFNVNTESYLVLSLTAKSQDITDVQLQFQQLDIKKVIFTKADETKQYGSMLNIVLKSHLGIAYLTNGQDVPEDLIRPTPEKIGEYIVSGYVDA